MLGRKKVSRSTLQILAGRICDRIQRPAPHLDQLPRGAQVSHPQSEDVLHPPGADSDSGAFFKIAYWVHTFPEFYFQKVKKEDARPRAFIAIIFIAFITFGYAVKSVTPLTRDAFQLHASRSGPAPPRVRLLRGLPHYPHPALPREEDPRQEWVCIFFKPQSRFRFKIWNVIFVLVRIATAVLAVMTFWYGLRQSEVPAVDVAAGNFNTSYIR